MPAVFAFACSVSGVPEWGESIYNRATRGQAKADYWRHVTDAWPDVPFLKIRARKVGAPVSSEQFIRNAVYRGMPDARCGDQVKVGDCNGVIVGHNSSANFDILFSDGKWAGMTLNVHPSSVSIVRE